MMKYKVTSKTEIITNFPYNDGTIYGILNPGFIVDIVQEVIEPNTDNIWLRDINGFYYIKNNLEPLFSKNLIEIDSLETYELKIANWNKGNFDVTRFWPTTTGRGIKIAVIDSGIFPHIDLVDAIDWENQRSFGSTIIQDTIDHGTPVAGIIAARGISDMYGIAPESTIVPIKVGEDNNFSNKDIIDAIEYASSLNEINIINLSLKADSNDKSGINQLRDVINDAINKGIIIVAPSGNGYSSKISPPAKFKGVIAVGTVLIDESLSKESFMAWSGAKFGNLERKIDICAPGFKIKSCKNQEKGTEHYTGTSFSAAYISGIIALKLQNNPGMNSNDILKAFSNSIFQYAKHNNNSDMKIPVLDPYLFINI